MARRASSLPVEEYDCLTCGACCFNAAENVREGVGWWVEVEPKDAILERRKLASRYVVYDGDGVPHLRMDPSGRCTALRGKLGQSVKCAIYDARPRACMKVMPGDNRCLQYRREKGIDPV